VDGVLVPHAQISTARLIILLGYSGPEFMPITTEFRGLVDSLYDDWVEQLRAAGEHPEPQVLEIPIGK
jgi:hypothetical protein